MISSKIKPHMVLAYQPGNRDYGGIERVTVLRSDRFPITRYGRETGETWLGWVVRNDDGTEFPVPARYLTGPWEEVCAAREEMVKARSAALAVHNRERLAADAANQRLRELAEEIGWTGHQPFFGSLDVEIGPADFQTFLDLFEKTVVKRVVLRTKIWAADQERTTEYQRYRSDGIADTIEAMKELL
jgi:hypothetical protein